MIGEVNGCSIRPAVEVMGKILDFSLSAMGRFCEGD